MKLYYSPLSTFSAKVRIALFEKGIEPEIISVTWNARDGWVKPAELKKLNPRQQIPVLIDGDAAVYDSSIILEYLEETHPSPPLFPKNPVDRARCRIIEDGGDTMIVPNVGVFVRELVVKSDPSTRDQVALERAGAELRKIHQELDRELRGREYLCGSFSVADISCFAPTNIARALGIQPDESCSNFRGWLARVENRPAVKRYLAEFMEGLARANLPAAQAAL
jgi:glutathione S-transferase